MSAPPPNSDRAAALQTLLHLLESVTKTVRVTVRSDSGHLLSVTIPPATPKADPSDRDCRQDILAVLREAGYRMTTTEILTELDRRKWLWGERTVKGYLSEMVIDGDLDKSAKVHPPGYGLVQRT
jgi:hypothetical protein